MMCWLEESRCRQAPDYFSSVTRNNLREQRWLGGKKTEELQKFGGKRQKWSPSSTTSPLLSLHSLPCSSAAQHNTCFVFSVKYLLSPPSILLLFISYHLEQGLQQPVVSVPVRLGPVEAISVVTVDIVLRASVLVDHVQSLVQGLRRQPGRRGLEVLLLVPPGGRRPGWWGLLQGRALAVEGRLKEAQQGHGGGGGEVGGCLGLFVRQKRLRGLLDLCLWRWRDVLDLLLSRQTGVSHTNTAGGTNDTSVSVRTAKQVTPTAFFISCCFKS